MDNLTHTLIGAALAESGLRRRTRYAAAAMMIGANIPDVDVVAVPLGRSLEWRRGVTHGIPALILWPFVLTALIVLWHRRRGSRKGPRAGATIRARHERDRPPLRVPQLLLVSTVAVLTHPFYDWLNTYGMRWLMPFSGTWYYGDSLFIIDPYLLGALLLGVFLSRRRARQGAPYPFTPARVAVAAAACYTAAMFTLHEGAERLAVEASTAAGTPPARLMVAPTPGNPFRWLAVTDQGTHYHRRDVRLLASLQVVRGDSIATGADAPAAIEAAASRGAAAFLNWARFPVFRQNPAAGTVTIFDLRYASPDEAGGWASVTVPIPRSTR